MNTFAFIIHPLNVKKQVGLKYPWLSRLPSPLIETFLACKNPFAMASMKGIVSESTSEEVEGILIACPLSPRILSQKSGPLERLSYRRLNECVQLAKDYGAQIVGLGAFTACSGDGGVSLYQEGILPITTGNTYTVASALEATILACGQVGINPNDSRLAIVGANGSIGKACAKTLAPRFRQTELFGRDPDRLRDTASDVRGHVGHDHDERVWSNTNLLSLRGADVIIVATSDTREFIHPKHLKAGSVIVDVSRPRNVSTQVARLRPDVLLIDGGIICAPGTVRTERLDRIEPFDFGLPVNMLYACMAETAMLALEQKFTPFSVGKSITMKGIGETSVWAARHGFRLAGLRAFEQPITEEQIARVRYARIRAGRGQALPA